MIQSTPDHGSAEGRRRMGSLASGRFIHGPAAGGRRMRGANGDAGGRPGTGGGEAAGDEAADHSNPQLALELACVRWCGRTCRRRWWSNWKTPGECARGLQSVFWPAGAGGGIAAGSGTGHAVF